MPKAAFFAWGQNQPREILCLPRGSSSPSVGCYVALKNGDWPGPMSPGDYAVTVEDTGAADTPFLVQELVSGRLWRYPEAALQRVPDDVVPHDVRHPSHPGEGSYVTLVHDYKRFSDAGRGPLSLMRTEDAYGLVLMESGQRFRVRSCHTGKDWWYDHGAVRPIHMKYVPEALRAAVRPSWGDYVALTHDHSIFGSAADGPLEPGNLGVVVAVTERTDSQGGLMQARYCVRSCHNGQSYRYQEGALHLVVQQLLHAPKIPPSTGKGRRRKLACQLHITEAGSGSHVPMGQVLLRGSIQQVHLVQPGKKYWIAAQLSCKGEDLMLANLKPTAWDLYAPSGRPGHYVHLKPVPCSQQQQWQQQQLLSGSPELMQQQQQQGPQLLSLACCNGAAAGGSAAAGSCAWYNAQDDVLFGVFEWDSAETPLTHKLGRVTEVSFVWGVCFKGVQGQFTKQQIVRVQTVQQSSSSSSSSNASTVAASAAVARQQRSVITPAAAADCRSSSQDTAAAAADGYASDASSNSVVFEWLDVAGNSSSSRRNGRSSSNSNSSDSEDDDDAGEGDDSSGSDSSSEASAEEEHAEDTENIAAGAADTDRGRRDTSGNNGGGTAGGQGSNSRIDGGGNDSSGNVCRERSGGGSSSSGGSGGGEEGRHTAPPTPPAGATGSTAADAAAAADVAHARLAAAAAAGFAVGLSGSSSSMSAAEAASAGFGTGEGCGDTADVGGSSSSSSARYPSTPELHDTGAASRCDGGDGSAEGSSVGSSSVSSSSSSSRSAQHPACAASSSSSSSSGRGCDCDRDDSWRDQQQQQQQPSRVGPPSSGSSSSRSGLTSRAESSLDAGQDSEITPPAAAAAAAAVRGGSHGLLRSSAAAAVLGGGVQIGEIMRQVERQAEAREPCWQQGNELAAALAAAAMAAAEDFLPGNWCRPRFQSQRQQQQQRDQQQSR